MEVKPGRGENVKKLKERFKYVEVNSSAPRPHRPNKNPELQKKYNTMRNFRTKPLDDETAPQKPPSNLPPSNESQSLPPKNQPPLPPAPTQSTNIPPTSNNNSTPLVPSQSTPQLPPSQPIRRQVERSKRHSNSHNVSNYATMRIPRRRMFEQDEQSSDSFFEMRFRANTLASRKPPVPQRQEPPMNTKGDIYKQKPRYPPPPPPTRQETEPIRKNTTLSSGNWQKLRTIQGEEYYWNKVTGESSWNPPTEQNIEATQDFPKNRVEPESQINSKFQTDLESHSATKQQEVKMPLRNRAHTLFSTQNEHLTPKPLLNSVSMIFPTSGPVKNTVTIPDDAWNCVVLSSLDQEFTSFMLYLKKNGIEKDGKIVISLTLNEKTVTLLFSSPVLLGTNRKPHYVTELADIPENQTVFLILSTGSFKDLKIWKNDMIKAKIRYPTIIVALTDDKQLSYQEKIDNCKKIEATNHCEFDTEGHFDPLIKLVAATTQRANPSKQIQLNDRNFLVDDFSRLRTKTDSKALVKDTLTQLLEKISKQRDSLDIVDMKVLKSLIFGYPEKLVKKCQDRVHKRNNDWFFSFRTDYKISKYLIHFKIKKLNTSHYSSITITNNRNTKAKFHFEQNYYFSSNLFLAFYPSSGDIEKGKSQVIKIGCVGFTPGILEEVFILRMEGSEGDLFFDNFCIGMKIEIENNQSPAFWEIDSNELDTLRQIGTGAAAQVYLCTLWGVEVAVKKWEYGRLGEPPRDFTRELETIKNLRHSNCVSFLGAVTKVPGRAFIITEYLSRGSLDMVLRDKKISLSFVQRLKMAIDINKGMIFMHNQGKMHRDLKSLNLLVDQNFNVKVADFGESRDMMNIYTMTRGVGTYLWMAPEIVRDEPYSFAADVFSFGMILWELLVGELPQRNLDDIARGNTPPIPQSCLPEYAFVMKRCWAFEPEKRPTFKETLEMLEFLYKQLTHDEDEKVQKVVRESLEASKNIADYISDLEG